MEYEVRIILDRLETKMDLIAEAVFEICEEMGIETEEIEGTEEVEEGEGESEESGEVKNGEIENKKIIGESEKGENNKNIKEYEQKN